MRVLLAHNRYRSSLPSGEDRVVDQEAAALADAGHRVERFERCSDTIAQRTVLRKALIPGQVIWSDEARRSLVKVLRRFRPDVVHLHNTFPLLSPSVLYGCRAERVPVVATLHNYKLLCANGSLFRDGAICHDCVGRRPVPAIRHGCYRDSTVATMPVAAATALHRGAWQTMVSAYVLLSSAQRDIFATAGWPAERLFVKANFVPSVAVGAAPPEDLVVYAGRLAPDKGIGLLMDAWDRYSAAAAKSNLRLVVAGTGPCEDRVKAWATTRSSVDCVGLLDRPGCARLLARARAAIVPSEWEETFGLVVVEAMAAGTAPVAPAHGSFPELITDGTDGRLFQPGSADALASVLQDVAADPERYDLLGRAGRHTYQRRFTVQANMAALDEIYRFAIEHPAG